MFYYIYYINDEYYNASVFLSGDGTLCYAEVMKGCLRQNSVLVMDEDKNEVKHKSNMLASNVGKAFR